MGMIGTMAVADIGLVKHIHEEGGAIPGDATTLALAALTEAIRHIGGHSGTSRDSVHHDVDVELPGVVVRHGQVLVLAQTAPVAVEQGIHPETYRAKAGARHRSENGRHCGPEWVVKREVLRLDPFLG